MRVYHSLVFDENVEGTTAVYTDPSFNAQLAITEKLHVYTLSDTAAGTSPTLTVQIEDSPDGVHFTNRQAGAEINGTSLSLTANTIIVFRDSGANLACGLARLRVQLGGTNPKAHVRIWVTGRGEHT